MEDRTVFLHEATHCFAIEDHSGLVVGHHDRDDGRIIPERLPQFIQIQATRLIDLEKSHLVAVPLFEIPAKTQHRRMFDGRGDQVPLFRIGVQGTDDGEVVALGTPAREYDLAGLGSPLEIRLYLFR